MLGFNQISEKKKKREICKNNLKLIVLKTRSSESDGRSDVTDRLILP